MQDTLSKGGILFDIVNNMLLLVYYTLANTRINAGDFSNIGYIYLMFV